MGHVSSLTKNTMIFLLCKYDWNIEAVTIAESNSPDTDPLLQFII